MIILKNENLVLEINPLGGGIARFYREIDGEVTEYIYGYQREEDKAGSMGDVLFPFPGRVKNCSYSFGGQNYVLSGLRIKDGHANHGFAKQSEWKVASSTENEACLEFEMRAEEYKDRGFPFSLQLGLTYTLNSDGFVCQAEVKNFGQHEAPFGLGFHPYFRVGEVNTSKINLPADKMIEFQNLEPTGKLLSTDSAPFDPSGEELLGGSAVDNCFTELNFSEGRATTELIFDTTKISVWQDKDFPYLQIYSADTLAEPHTRKAIAIEPQTCTGFALNHPEMGLITLGPGQGWQGSWGVDI
ncbi:MAG: hypothetical protein WC227_04610 [Patescibacteria group bacterium]|jgi:aldose 1-epimerase